MGWKVVGGSVLGKLECAEVSDDCPAVIHGDFAAVAEHRILPVGDGIENFSVGLVADTVEVEVCDGGKTEFVSGAIAEAEGTVANLAMDAVTFLAAVEGFDGDGDGEARAPLITKFAGVAVIG